MNAYSAPSAPPAPRLSRVLADIDIDLKIISEIMGNVRAPDDSDSVPQTWVEWFAERIEEIADRVGDAEITAKAAEGASPVGPQPPEPPPTGNV